MRGSAIWLASQLADAPAGRFDVLFTCDMTSVADLRALLPGNIRNIPIVCYFHENQLTYPLSDHDWQDYQFGFTNVTSALAADAVWFNSNAHMHAFLLAVRQLLRTMPENLTADVLPGIEAKSSVQYPPVEIPPKSDLQKLSGAFESDSNTKDSDASLRILWPHRWEYDKNPKPFFDALLKLHDSEIDFELVLLGETFRTAPPEFKSALAYLESRIHHAGFLPKREDYWALLQSCDVVVSTAIQENFGLAVVEAMLAGCHPLFPNRLSYPELLDDRAFEPCADRPCFYENDGDLHRILTQLCSPRVSAGLRSHGQSLRKSLYHRFGADHQVARLDQALSKLMP